MICLVLVPDITEIFSPGCRETVVQEAWCSCSGAVCVFFIAVLSCDLCPSLGGLFSFHFFLMFVRSLLCHISTGSSLLVCLVKG